MDLGSMLNTSQGPTDLEQEAISTYRRLSSGSTNFASGSPAVSESTSRQGEVIKQESIMLQMGDRSGPPSPSLKRKIDQVDRSIEGADDGTKIKRVVSKESTMKPSAQPNTSSAIKNKIDLAYTGKRPLDDLSTVIKSALMHYLNIDQRTYGKLGLEIEAKLGLLTDRESGRRLHELFPLHSATLIHPDYTSLRFVSNMTEEQHSRFNRHLNEQVELRNPKHPKYESSRPTIRYEHTKLTDSIYETVRQDGMDMKPRVTTNDKDGSVVEIISKETVTHLHVACPQHPFDVRLSINLEHSIQAPTGSSLPVHERQKDRVSYKLATHRIDLTKVGDARKGGGSYELEVEITDVENLKKQAELEFDERPNSFDEILVGFIGTVMTLNNTAATFSL